MKSYIAAVVFLLFTHSSFAVDFVGVDDMSKIKWQIQSSTGKVFIRNLDEFNSGFLGCCYNHYIETTTDEGKAVWSTILSHMMAGKPLSLGVTDKTQAGPIVYFGKW